MGRIAVRAAVLVMLALSGAVGWADEDPYLELLEEEATKVERAATDKSEDNIRKPRDGDVASSRSSSSRQEFETMLRRKHAGTFSFYRRLPERARDEIYVDYRKGASTEALRGKIIDRYLHP